MARLRYPPSTLCARLAALFIGLTVFGCAVSWFEDGAVGVASIVVLGTAGVLLAVAAGRLSRRDA